MAQDMENKLNDIVIDPQDGTTEAADETVSIEKLEKKLKKLKKKLSEQKELNGLLENEKDEYLTLLKKERAEFENFRKRKNAEAGASYQNGVCDAVVKMLPLLDNLEIALKSVPKEKQDDDFIIGIVNLLKLFRDTLDHLGILEIDAHGQPFSHDLHDAMMQVEKEAGEAEGIVKQVLQKGYMKDDKVLRYAKVIVTK